MARSGYDRSGYDPESVEEYMKLMQATKWMFCPAEFSNKPVEINLTLHLVYLIQTIAEYARSGPAPTHEQFWRHGGCFGDTEWRWYEFNYEKSQRMSRIKYSHRNQGNNNNNNNLIQKASTQSNSEFQEHENDEMEIDTFSPDQLHSPHMTDTTGIICQFERNVSSDHIGNISETTNDAITFNSNDAINYEPHFKPIRESKMRNAKDLSKKHPKIVTIHMEYDGQINNQLINNYTFKDDLKMHIVNNKLHSLYYTHSNGHTNELIIQYDKNGVSQMTQATFVRKFNALRKRIERKNEKINMQKHNKSMIQKRYMDGLKKRGRYEEKKMFIDSCNEEDNDTDNDDRMNGGYNNGNLWKSSRLRRNKIKERKRNNKLYDF